MSEQDRLNHPSRLPVQLTLPFTEVIEGANRMLCLAEEPDEVEAIQYWLALYLHKTFGAPIPEASGE